MDRRNDASCPDPTAAGAGVRIIDLQRPLRHAPRAASSLARSLRRMLVPRPHDERPRGGQTKQWTSDLRRRAYAGAAALRPAAVLPLGAWCLLGPPAADESAAGSEIPVWRCLLLVMLADHASAMHARGRRFSAGDALWPPAPLAAGAPLRAWRCRACFCIMASAARDAACSGSAAQHARALPHRRSGLSVAWKHRRPTPDACASVCC
jgi:hypothetical protein